MLFRSLGAAIEPTGSKVVAPADGEVSTIFDTRHAVGLTLDNGIELLVHIGMDTVELNGEGFQAFVNEGDKVRRGQTLITFDREFITSKGYSLLTPVIVSNSDDFAKVSTVAGKEVKELDNLLMVEKE